ncbi:MAG: cobalt-precorrin-6A reductase [Hyphomicrobiaceae bacterium]
MSSHRRQQQNLLILGGTIEARKIAAILVNDPQWSVTLSLAGLTRQAQTILGATRIGGFGGTKGLIDFIESRNVDTIVDATHPFATVISANARSAARHTARRYLSLCRPPWSPKPGDTWINAADVPHAATLLPPGTRALLAIGHRNLAALFARTDVTLFARTIEPLGIRIPPHVRTILARPPFTVEDETSLLSEHKIGIVVAKNSGGAIVDTKLVAARMARLPVIMIARPAHPKADAESVDQILSQLPYRSS